MPTTWSGAMVCADASCAVPAVMSRTTCERCGFLELEAEFHTSSHPECGHVVKWLLVGAAERALLHLLELEEYIEPGEFELRAHLSRRTAADAIVRLAALGIVDFIYRGGRFVVGREPADGA